MKHPFGMKWCLTLQSISKERNLFVCRQLGINDEEFKSHCAVKSSGNTWMKEGKTSYRCPFVQQTTFSLGFLQVPDD